VSVFSGLSSVKLSSVECAAYRGPMDRYPVCSVELSGSFRVTFGLFVASLMMPSLAVSFPFCNDGFIGALWDYQSF